MVDYNRIHEDMKFWIEQNNKKNDNRWRTVNYQVGDVVQTANGYDRGLVTKVDKNNKPVEIMASPTIDFATGERNVINHYGGVNTVRWYKTGEYMTQEDWYELYSGESGWRRYVADVNKQICFKEEPSEFILCKDCKHQFEYRTGSCPYYIYS